jgi:hypothetical protein
MDRVGAALKQTWWAPLAALLVVSNAATGVVILLNEQNPGSLVGGSLFLVGAVAMAAGLLIREGARTVASGLILFGAFWGLPIVWLVVPPLLALAVGVGVFRDGITPRASHAAAVR